MNILLQPHSIELLERVDLVLSSPLLGVAASLSELVRPLLGHSALVIFTEDCTGRPQKKAGDPRISDRVSIAELDTLRCSLPEGSAPLWLAGAMIGAEVHPVAVWLAATGALLVLTDPEPGPESESDETPGRPGTVTEGGASEGGASEERASEDGPETGPDRSLAVIGQLWELVAAGIRRQVAAAPPAYLFDSRAASAERARVIADLTDAHATTLESLLAVLRARDASPEAARQNAIDLTTKAMVRLRAVSDRDRSLSEEPVAQAFERLRDDLRPLVRFGDLDVQFIEPPLNGRALPGEVAHAGRAIVRGAVLALIDQEGVGRVRVQWDCDGSNLLIRVRDDGPGDLTTDVPSVSRLAGRVAALSGSLEVEATAGWGSEMVVTLPLDAPVAALAPAAEWGLSPREQGVLELVASGLRNRAIAEALSISENTVKFHVANLLRKVGASTRAELASLAR